MTDEHEQVGLRAATVAPAPLRFPVERTGRTPDDVPSMTTDNQSCKCGGEWWMGGSVVFSADGPVTAHTIDWRCVSCREPGPVQQAGDERD